MKNFKISIAWMAVFALVFTSCSKDETGVVSDDSEKVQVTFGALLNAFDQQNKQADFECNDDAVPAYVMVGGSSDPNVIPGANDLIKVGLKNNNGSWETLYSPELALPAGVYYLQHFAVYDENDQVLWVAPREGSTFESEVGDALPMQINLVAGTKPYIDVDVLCYIAREEVAYGYPFFDFDVVPVENSYCVFVNYCDDVTGREYPANFRLDIWTDGYGGANLLTTGMNTVDIPEEGEEGWPAATVLCIALPEIVGDDLYARVTVLNDGQAYTPGAGDVHEFRISQAHLNAIEASETGYEHFRIGCDGDTPPPPSDCVPEVSAGCEQIWESDATVSPSGGGISDLPKLIVFDNSDSPIGEIRFDFDDGTSELTAYFDMNPGYVITAGEINLDDVSGGDVTNPEAPVTLCLGNITEEDFNISWDLDDIEGLENVSAMNLFPIIVDYKINVCEAPE